MEIHAGSTSSSSSAIHISREEHGVAPLQLSPWSKEEGALQTRDGRLLSIDGGGAQSDSSCCCCSVTTCCDGCQTFDSDSATTEQLLPVNGIVGSGDLTTECQQGFGTLKDAEGGGDGGFARSHSSPSLAKGSSPSEYSSSVCVKERSIEVEELHSENGLFRFVLQSDRTLVLYMGDDDLWAVYLAPRACEANTTVRLILQKDGNLVAVDSSFRLVWESKTANKAPGPYTLAMENNGNCTLCAEGGVYLWATRTARWS